MTFEKLLEKYWPQLFAALLAKQYKEVQRIFSQASTEYMRANGVKPLSQRGDIFAGMSATNEAILTVVYELLAVK